MSYFPLALPWSLIELTIFTGTTCNMSILLLHLQSYIDRNFKVALARKPIIM